MAFAAQAPGNGILDFSFNAGGDCSSAAAAASSSAGPNGSFQYCGVVLSTNDIEIVPSSSVSGNGIKVIGVLQNAPAASQAATVRMLGLSKLVVDGSAGTIVPGSKLAADAVGRGIATTTANDEIFAVALAGSTVKNDIIPVFVTPMMRY